MSDEWRVEVELGDEEHHLTLGERMRSLDLDDEARARLGDRVIVTRDGSHMFLYAGSEQAAREAERVARELIASEALTGEVSLTRWIAHDEAWEEASASPARDSGGAEVEEATAERREQEETAERREQEGTAERREEEGTAERREHDWEVRVDLPGPRETHELAGRLEEEGLDVRRRWRHLLAGAATEDEAAELAERLASEAPEGAEVHVEPSGGVPHPVFVFIGAHKPGIARDLGL